MRTARSLPYGGVSVRWVSLTETHLDRDPPDRDPPDRDPLDRDPLWTETLPRQRPPGQRPPGQRPPSPSYVTCGVCWDRDPPRVNRMTHACENITLPQLRCGRLKPGVNTCKNIKMHVNLPKTPLEIMQCSW